MVLNRQRKLFKFGHRWSARVRLTRSRNGCRFHPRMGPPSLFDPCVLSRNAQSQSILVSAPSVDAEVGLDMVRREPWGWKGRVSLPWAVKEANGACCRPAEEFRSPAMSGVVSCLLWCNKTLVSAGASCPVADTGVRNNPFPTTATPVIQMIQSKKAIPGTLVLVRCRPHLQEVSCWRPPLLPGRGWPTCDERRGARQCDGREQKAEQQVRQSCTGWGAESEAADESEEEDYSGIWGGCGAGFLKGWTPLCYRFSSPGVNAAVGFTDQWYKEKEYVSAAGEKKSVNTIRVAQGLMDQFPLWEGK